MQSIAAKKEIIIKISMDSDSGYVEVDKRKINQVLYNLVGNAKIQSSLIMVAL